MIWKKRKEKRKVGEFWGELDDCGTITDTLVRKAKQSTLTNVCKRANWLFPMQVKRKKKKNKEEKFKSIKKKCAQSYSIWKANDSRKKGKKRKTWPGVQVEKIVNIKLERSKKKQKTKRGRRRIGIWSWTWSPFKVITWTKRPQRRKRTGEVKKAENIWTKNNQIVYGQAWQAWSWKGDLRAKTEWH